MDRPASVMVVDDLPRAAGRLAQSLRRLGYEVVVAFSAADALDLAHARTLQLVLVQAHLGGNTGLDLCRRLGWRRPELPVIAVTSSTGLELADQVREAGALDLVVCPVSDGELCYRVERALKRRQLEQHIKSLREVAATWSSLPVGAH